MNPLLAILVCITAMYVIGELLRPFVPRAISQILTGILLGLPLLRGIIFSPESSWLVGFFAQVGAILLLFFVGLQISFEEFGKNIKTSAWVSILNTIIPLALGFFVCRLFGLSISTSIMVGVCLSVSASALALDLLEEMGKLRSRLGKVIISAGTFDDILELFLLTAVLTTLKAAQGSTFLHLVFGSVVFIVVVLIFRLWFIPWILFRIESQKEHAQLFTGALIITLVMAVIGEYLGVGALIGALLSGVLLRQLLKQPNHEPWEHTEVTHTIHTLAFGFIVPFFFFSIGFQTNVLSIVHNLWFGIVITTIAILGTWVGSAIGYYFSHKNLHEANIIGWAMNAKGDTELIMAQLALTTGVISTAIFSSLIFMAIVSTLVAPIVLKRLLRS